MDIYISGIPIELYKVINSNIILKSSKNIFDMYVEWAKLFTIKVPLSRSRGSTRNYLLFFSSFWHSYSLRVLATSTTLRHLYLSCTRSIVFPKPSTLRYFSTEFLTWYINYFLDVLEWVIFISAHDMIEPLNLSAFEKKKRITSPISIISSCSSLLYSFANTVWLYQ